LKIIEPRSEGWRDSSQIRVSGEPNRRVEGNTEKITGRVIPKSRKETIQRREQRCENAKVKPTSRRLH